MHKLLYKVHFKVEAQVDKVKIAVNFHTQVDQKGVFFHFHKVDPYKSTFEHVISLYTCRQ
jgi:hypothetical protein